MIQEPKPLPPLDHLRECLSYDPDTGALIWMNRPVTHFKAHMGTPADQVARVWNARHASTKAGKIDRKGGHIDINIDGKFFKAHRLAYFLHFGNEPDGGLEHIDRDKLNNRIENLRIVGGGE